MSQEAERRPSPTNEPGTPRQDVKSKPGAKPRASRAGTRSVTTLNAEQLARKRANDREAQRAIRQRTREHIDRLENRIKELSENNPDSDAALEAVQRRNAELEEELRLLRITLYGLGECTDSPGGSHQQPGYVANPGAKMGSYSAQWVSSQNVLAGPAPYVPTLNPNPGNPEPEQSWQPQLSTHGGDQRGSHPQQYPGFGQHTPWSRNDSSDSDYDSAFGREHEPVAVAHSARGHPDHMQNFYSNTPTHMGRQNPHHARQDDVWHHPGGPTSNGPFEGPPNARDGQTTYGINASFISQPSTPGVGAPHPQITDLDAYL